jgi:hypothetical protein
MAKSSRTKPLRQQPAFKKLRELLKQTGQHDLLWHHRAGECVEKLFPREGGRQYGQGRMTEITTALGKPENFANDLWKCRDFYWVYDRDEVKSLRNRNSTEDFQITWTHIVRLLAVEDAAKRRQFQDECFGRCWTTDELQRAVNDFQGRRSFGGRSFARPKTLDAGLRQIIDESQTWIRRHQQVWFAPDDPVISESGEVESPVQIPELFDEAVASWETMEFLVKEHLPRLKQMRAWFKKQASPKKKRKTARRAKKKASRKR